MRLSKNNVVLIGTVKSITHDSAKEDVSISKITIETFEESEWGGKKTSRNDEHKLIAFGRLAEKIKGHITNGDNIYVEGKLRSRTIVVNNRDILSSEVMCSKIENLSKAPTNHADKLPLQDLETTTNPPYRDIPF